MKNENTILFTVVHEIKEIRSVTMTDKELRHFMKMEGNMPFGAFTAWETGKLIKTENVHAYKKCEIETINDIAYPENDLKICMELKNGILI
jgi:hypothetical protein